MNLVDDDKEEENKTPPKLEIPDFEDSNPPPDETGHPNPEQRADFVVKRLEQFIREGRTIAEGMSLKQWQDMARFEITNAIMGAENAQNEGEEVSKRLLFTVAASLTTIGFWGVLFAYDKVHYLVVATIFAITGIVLLAIVGEWRLMKYFRRHQARQRERTIHRVEDLPRRIKRMEKELKEEHRSLQSKLKRQFDRKREEILEGLED
ncbi:MAG: hypothetical protein HOE26_10250 [Rhodospirillaceae bacterium]|nr:hypothetical protein [Rhodospirillaceae bacterium]